MGRSCIYLYDASAAGFPGSVCTTGQPRLNRHVGQKNTGGPIGCVRRGLTHRPDDNAFQRTQPSVRDEGLFIAETENEGEACHAASRPQLRRDRRSGWIRVAVGALEEAFSSASIRHRPHLHIAFIFESTSTTSAGGGLAAGCAGGSGHTRVSNSSAMPGGMKRVLPA